MNNGWISVDDRLPENMKHVLAFYYNEYGKGRKVIAEYIHHKTVESCDYYSEETEGDEYYDEENDKYWVNSGWHEQLDNWDYSGVPVVNGKVIYWMTLPESPKVN